MAKFSKAVKNVLKAVSGEKIQRLFEVKNSKAVLDRLAHSILLKRDRKLSADTSAAACLVRIREIETEVAQIYPKV